MSFTVKIQFQSLGNIRLLYKHIMEANVGESSGEGAALATPDKLKHDLVYVKNRRIVKTHIEVEEVMSRHNWKLNTPAPVNDWVDYVYQPPNTTDEIRPLAGLPAPSLTNLDAAPDDWKIGFFHASLHCVREFAARVNTVTGVEVFHVQEVVLY